MALTPACEVRGAPLPVTCASVNSNVVLSIVLLCKGLRPSIVAHTYAVGGSDT